VSSVTCLHQSKCTRTWPISRKSRSSRGHATPRTGFQVDEYSQDSGGGIVFINCTLDFVWPQKIQSLERNLFAVRRLETIALRHPEVQNFEHGKLQEPHAILGIVSRLGGICERHRCTRRTQHGEDCRRRSHERGPDSAWFRHEWQRMEMLTQSRIRYYGFTFF
jgi:hypothetical protein